ncbi:hypothetical protein ACFL3I_05465 [Pseudomonadota bacterium]
MDVLVLASPLVLASWFLPFLALNLVDVLVLLFFHGGCPGSFLNLVDVLVLLFPGGCPGSFGGCPGSCFLLLVDVLVLSSLLVDVLVLFLFHGSFFLVLSSLLVDVLVLSLICCEYTDRRLKNALNQQQTYNDFWAHP